MLNDAFVFLPSATMRSAVSTELVASFHGIPFHIGALGLSDHELLMVFSNQPHEPIREYREPANQIPIGLFEAFSFRAVLSGKVHPVLLYVQEEPAGPNGLDGSWTISWMLGKGLRAFSD